MPHYEVHCPCGRTPVIYGAPSRPAPKYCNMECRRRYYTGSGKQKYFFSPEMDAEIRGLYLNEVGIKAVKYTGPVKALAKKFGMPRWAISYRACRLGILPMQKKEPDWSPEEEAILERNAHLVPRSVWKHLKKAGFSRSITGITVKRKRMHLSRSSMDGYTCRSLAQCFGIDDHGVMRWIGKGWLKARRRGTARTPQQGGDEWYITDAWVRKFIIHNIAVIDIRKVDKYWLVDMLAGGYHGLGRLEERTDDGGQMTEEEEIAEIFEQAQGMVN